MDARAKYELYLIKEELRSIIRELDDIADDIRRDFSNIGEDQVASCVSRVSDKYRTVRQKLDNIDTDKLVEGPLGGGGSR